MVALTDRARNEPRDLYDIWYLVRAGRVDLGEVKDAVEQKWKFRGKTLADVSGEFAAKEQRYKRLWGPRLSGQLVALPEFGEVYRAVRRAFRQAGLAGK